MPRQYFGTDGIRGTVGKSPITPDFVLRLGHAVGRVLRRGEDRPTVLIGKDTRISGYMLRVRWNRVSTPQGDVVLLGPLPTAWLTSRGPCVPAWRGHQREPQSIRRQRYQVLQRQGTKLPDAWEEAVEAALAESPVWVDSAQLGKARRLDDAQAVTSSSARAPSPTS
jgi:phosphoglucosamine mutase